MSSRLFGWFHALYTTGVNNDDGERYARWFLTTFGLVLLVVAIASVPFAVASSAGLRFVGLAILVGATGFTVGGLLGFLFGVPRVSAATSNDTAGENAAGQSVVQSNTNLEEVSDWLTKIVVGVSLVEFGKVNDALNGFSAEVNKAFPCSASPTTFSCARVVKMGVLTLSCSAQAPTRGISCVPNGGFAACLILIGAAVCGFLSAYLKSRINLPRAFNSLVAAAKKSVDQVGQSSFAAEARRIIQYPLLTPDPAARTAAADVLSNLPPGIDDPGTLRLSGFAQAILKNFSGAAKALSEAAQSDPDNDLKVLAARASAISGDLSAANRILPASTMSDTVPLTAQEFEVELARLFVMLYGKDIADVQNAVALGVRLSQDPAGRTSPRVWLYLSSAYGQLYAATKQSNAADPALSDLRLRTLASIDKALEFDRRNNLPILQMLWQVRYPGKPADENDLEAFGSDPDFAKRLDPPPEGDFSTGEDGKPLTGDAPAPDHLEGTPVSGATEKAPDGLQADEASETTKAAAEDNAHKDRDG